MNGESSSVLCHYAVESKHHGGVQGFRASSYYCDHVFTGLVKPLKGACGAARFHGGSGVQGLRVSGEWYRIIRWDVGSPEGEGGRVVRQGVMATSDETTRKYFEGTKVFCKLAFRGTDQQMNFIKANIECAL